MRPDPEGLIPGAALPSRMGRQWREELPPPAGVGVDDDLADDEAKDSLTDEDEFKIVATKSPSRA